MLPTFSHLFGIQPWDLERLTVAELAEYVRQAREYNAAIKRAGS